MLETLLFMIALLGITVVEGLSSGPGLAALFLALAFGAAALMVKGKGNGVRARELGVRAAAFLLFTIFLFGLKIVNSRLAVSGVERIAAACEAYNAEHGAYPENLGQLVPEYMGSLPRARLSIKWGGYKLKDNRVSFVMEPGRLVRVYDLALKKWSIAPHI